MDTSVVRFAIVGGLGTIVNSGYLILFKEYFALPLWLSSVLAILIAMVFNFILNDNFTFDEIRDFSYIRLIQFVGVCTIGAAINVLVLVGLTFFGVFYLLANIAGILCAFGFNYTMSRKFIWRHVDEIL